ncbi:hypothetical protein A3G67_02890 [Candidatus Roizmanbacteria bacterium RIFCSPLOWO2_12_FULL_40_12]|uniref:AB hydrolase-1 domain-containing protein n=1 Tax=Candidatus Roizmanbacteria bacterium RIFCSPLOWO2_01_FULL_40_42 TaxID=1802066 RepID=A0A1F7J2Q1_9BACT|nr:MAG: hypothetical protein A2779_00420 [Candidatus Roizmanbacteria bacterium RIFCSPHIGHO2_01_FULL_40_98]OGK27524.1 MAG: hypothetical protein A3C31_03575 [Candidatus Roizmanbacteria bacterium RIFCSPHIGHO2_02_FULL_40_53]OGK30280.1 MAG: hypothetical protein A2W49_01060 [Candidatus Roizmanbacteria bacterium RIFCSPHIGHO2_12_41_18]OGK37120.1 MAG: hypothetical protein A3E69_01535 [Candidatus Roizmanbacteria bacterium RIFCSPHIGHO2_12_FULL_40_130]OGK49886.1 MAG: hypothetical protein A3B50_03815 [Candi
MLTQIHGKTVSFEVLGKGETVLFIHGWGGSRESLRKLAESVSQKYKAVLIDLPGFGRSENPDPSWGIDEYTAIVARFLQKQRLSPVYVFGHSFGGTLALYLAVRYPKLVKKLVLCAPSYKRGGKKAPFASLLKNAFPRPIKRLLYGIFFPTSELYKYPHLEPNFRKIVTQDVSADMKLITVPTLILWGDKDSYVPVSHGRRLQKIIKDSQLEIFKGIGHGLPVYEPEKVYKSLEKFL